MMKTEITEYVFSNDGLLGLCEANESEFTEAGECI